MIRASAARNPAVRRFAFRALDFWCQVALLPFRRRMKRGSASENAELTPRTDELNRMAESYFLTADRSEFLLRKPFSDSLYASKHLIDLGVLLGALKMMPGHTVLEFGAGTCWLSQMLNLFGCRTIAVDVSASALSLGRQMFERDPRTNWDLDPQFLAYDGHRIPLPAASCDRVIINDAFHHVPNQREVLAELQRVLRPDGLLGMSEPGHDHGSAPQSLEETSSHGVLENELVLEDLIQLIRSCGFDSVSLAIANSSSVHQIDAADLGGFMGGKGFPHYWAALCGALRRHHYIVCEKTAGLAPSTRRPDVIAAHISPANSSVRAKPNAPIELSLPLTVTNTGNTTWLGGEIQTVGWTRLGAHLFRREPSRQLIDFDWWRGTLPAEVAPKSSLERPLRLPPIAEPGEYEVVVDLVVEGWTWFASTGSKPAVIAVTVA